MVALTHSVYYTYIISYRYLHLLYTHITNSPENHYSHSVSAYQIITYKCSWIKSHKIIPQ